MAESTSMHASLARAFRSERLVYRSIESPEDDDFVLSVIGDADAEISSSISLPKPKSKKDAQGYIKDLNEKAILSVIVCLDPNEEDAIASSATTTTTTVEKSDPSHVLGIRRRLTPIGMINLMNTYGNARQHRQGQFGINIIPSHQGRGYGAEAIRWLLQWGFDMAGLHRIRLGVFEWNARAIRLYKRIGFRLESTEKEALWFSGRWWDSHWMAMLEDEWREKWRDVREVYDSSTK